MSKTLTEIQNEITTAKESYAELDELNSTSKASIWGLIRDVVAQVIYTLYMFFDLYKAEIKEIVDKGFHGTSAWFTNEIKKFQYGYDLVLNTDFDTAFYEYQNTDEDAQIVQQVALEQLGDKTLIKVAKLNNEALTALSLPEQQALSSYVRLISYPGMFFQIQTANADLLVLEFNVYFNALFGEDAVRINIETALQNYLNTIVFNGKFKGSEAVDAVQAVDGVSEVYLKNASGRGNLTDLADAVVFDESYNSIAGYMKIDLLTLNMIPV